MSVNGRRRVVITGIGAVTPLGNDAETSWQNLLAGESGAAEITQFDSSDYFVHFACEVKDFDPSNWIERKQARRMDRFAQLILAAARQAEADSGIDIAPAADRIGASIATGIGGIKSFQDCYDTLIERGPDRVNPFAIPCIIPNMGAGWVSMELGTRGPLSSECTRMELLPVWNVRSASIGFSPRRIVPVSFLTGMTMVRLMSAPSMRASSTLHKFPS